MIKNPLYVVTNSGSTVEQAANIFDAVVKKLGLVPVVEFFHDFLIWLFEQFNSFIGLEFITGVLDSFLGSLKGARA